MTKSDTRSKKAGESFFVLLGLELRAYALSHSTSPFFVMGVFEIGSLELFALASFKL
jgi:hypothetical protein